MIKKIKALLMFGFLLSIFVNQNFAVAGPDLGTSNGLGEKIGKLAQFNTNTNEYTLAETVGRIIKILLSFVGTIFFALTVYAGFLWMTAQGNEDKVAKAKDIIKTAVIGMIIVVAAYSITAWALIFSAQSTSLDVGV